MMMQPDDPSRSGIMIEGCHELARLADRNHAQRIGEGEIGVGVRIEDRDAEANILCRWKNERKELIPKARELVRQPKSALIREALDRLTLRRKRRRKREARLGGACAHDAQAVGAKSGHGGQSAHLAQGFRRAERQIEARWVSSVDDIHIVIARKDKRPFGEIRMARENVEEFGPFAGAAGVGHVPGDENEIQRPSAVLGLEPSHDPSHALIAARAAPPALDPEAITLTDDMDVGEMRDAPDATV